MEKQGGKGPRLFLSNSAREELIRCPLSWIVDHRPDSQFAEILWLLPPNETDITAMASLIRDLLISVQVILADVENDPEALPHYLGMVDVSVRSLLRLKNHQQRICFQICAEAGLKNLNRYLENQTIVAAGIQNQILINLANLVQ